MFMDLGTILGKKIGCLKWQPGFYVFVFTLES